MYKYAFKYCISEVNVHKGRTKEYTLSQVIICIDYFQCLTHVSYVFLCICWNSQYADIYLKTLDLGSTTFTQ